MNRLHKPGFVVALCSLFQHEAAARLGGRVFVDYWLVGWKRKWHAWLTSSKVGHCPCHISAPLESAAKARGSGWSLCEGGFVVSCDRIQHPACQHFATNVPS